MLPIKHPKLQQLYDYWSVKRGERKMPSRADIDPLDMTFVMGNVILVDVIAGEPPGFRIRLHGTTWSNALITSSPARCSTSCPRSNSAI